MAVIRLFGALARLGEKSFTVHVDSFDEAMAALKANYPLVANAMRDMDLSVLVNGDPIVFEDFLRPMIADTIDIVPVVGGNGPAGFILAGAGMIAGNTAIAAALGTVFAGVTTAMITQIGISLILGGVSQLLFKPPKPEVREAAESAPSYTFNGPVNTTIQGNCVPVGFGRLRIGSQLISANVQTFDIPVTQSTVPGSTLTPPQLQEALSNSPFFELH